MGCGVASDYELPMTYDAYVSEQMDFAPENLDQGKPRNVERDVKPGKMAEILPNMLFFS